MFNRVTSEFCSVRWWRKPWSKDLPACPPDVWWRRSVVERSRWSSQNANFTHRRAFLMFEGEDLQSYTEGWSAERKDKGLSACLPDVWRRRHTVDRSRWWRRKDESFTDRHDFLQSDKELKAHSHRLQFDLLILLNERAKFCERFLVTLTDNIQIYKFERAK